MAGMLAGWIATTEEGRKTANQFMNKAMKMIEESIQKDSTKKEENKA